MRAPQWIMNSIDSTSGSSTIFFPLQKKTHTNFLAWGIITDWLPTSPLCLIKHSTKCGTEWMIIECEHKMQLWLEHSIAKWNEQKWE